MNEQVTNETPRRYVTPADPPRKGDTIMLHGEARTVVSVLPGMVKFDPPGEWYWVTSLELVKAYYP